MSKMFLLLTVILMDFLSGMEFDLFVPSFPELQVHFDISSFWVEAGLSVNFIGYCLSLFWVGAMADRYGRKPLLLLGLILFVGGSLLCVWAPFYNLLLMGRFLQGIGVAAPAILSFLIIADSYPLSSQQRFLALLNGVMNISVAVAPLVGSYITFYFHWRGNFMALLALGLLVLILVLFIPNKPLNHKKRDSLVAGYLGLFKSKDVILFIGYFILMIAPYWIFVGMSPILYMKSLGVSLTHFGYYQGLLAFVFALGCFLYSGLLSKCSHKAWLLGSFVVLVLSLLSLGAATWFNCQNPLWITLSLLPFVISQIIPSTILYPLSLNIIPEAKGQVSAMIQGGRLIFCAISLQIAGYFYQGSFQTIGIIIVLVIAAGIVPFIIILQRWNVLQKYGVSGQT